MTEQELAAKFIIFAIKQAKEAEAFGFTRNSCCRNLKIAISHYWQHKVVGHHGQAHKAKIPRSRAASKLLLSECTVEHVMPQSEIVNRLMAMRPLTKTRVIAFLTLSHRVILVTHEEHARLNSSGLRSTMPSDWDGKDVFHRYAALGIKLAKQKLQKS